MMYKILVSDKLGQVGLDRLEAAEDAVYDLKTGMTPEELIATIPNYDALIIRSGTKVTADVLIAGKNLKVVGRAGIGVDNVDIRAATARGIIVMNTPTANSVATSEQTMALMLAASRNTAPAHASLLTGEWKRSQYAGTQLYQKVLGVIGFGRIGRLTTARAQGFGMEVVAYDPFVSEEVAQELGVTLLDLDDLLAQADYIALHTALTPDTEKMINADTIAKMKDGVILVNVARGKLIDEEALLAGLDSGKIQKAALDVYTKEPPDPNNPLIGHSKVLHTPHLGASTKEAQRDVATQIADQVLDALRGVAYRNALNVSFNVGADFDKSRPYIALAEKIGVLHAYLAYRPLQKVEMTVSGEQVEDLVRPMAAAFLKGLLSTNNENVNYINAPLLAKEQGIAISQTTGTETLPDYSNLISCKVQCGGGERVIAGVLFGGSEPRIVQLEGYQLEAKPEGTILILKNKDVPGVVGQVGTILGTYDVNIAEWRMGRQASSGQSLSFINLDHEPPAVVLDALEKMPAITSVRLINL